MPSPLSDIWAYMFFVCFFLKQLFLEAYYAYDELHCYFRSKTFSNLYFTALSSPINVNFSSYCAVFRICLQVNNYYPESMKEVLDIGVSFKALF